MITLLSPSKINLFLRVLGKRSDGYHELATLMQTIDLADTLQMSKSSHDRLSCSDPHLPMDSSNLVHKALTLFRKKTGVTDHFEIHLDKHVPMAGGLGGGSGNAATTLWGLNELCGKTASLEQLIEWSGELGSDVTIFLSSGTAYCTGRGEKIRSLKPLAPQKLWIVKPEEGLSTPQVFRHLNLTALEPRDPEKCLNQFLQGKPVYFNDLEAAAFALSPILALLKQQCQNQGFSTVLMSGSGTSFYLMGDKTPVLAPEFLVYRAAFIQRQDGAWYSPQPYLHDET